MKKAILILYLIISFSNNQAQPTFQKTFGSQNYDGGASVQQTSDGGYIVLGSTVPFAYLLKTDSKGDTLWTKTYGGSGSDYGASVQQTVDGGYIIVGTTNFGAGSTDVYLIKTDVNGDPLWTKAYGGTGVEQGMYVQETSDGGYIITGFTISFGAGGSDVYLIKTDSIGDTLWTRTFGGTSDDYGHSVYQATDGGYVIVGYTNSFGAGGNDVYVIKTNSSGDTLWTKTFGGMGSDKTVPGSSGQTTDGGYIITGYTTSFGWGAGHFYLIRIDSMGDTLWTRAYGGPDSDQGMSVQQTVDGGYIVTGITTSFGDGPQNVYLVKTDPNGDTLWTRVFGGDTTESGLSVLQTIDGGYIITGSTTSFGAGGFDIYLIKTDSNGNSGGCYESSTNTEVVNTATIIGSGAIVGSGGLVSNPTTIVGNPLFIDSVICTSVGIKEKIVSKKEIIVYPNPNTGQFTLEIDLHAETRLNIKLYNFTGQLIHSEVIANVTGNYTQQIDLSRYAKGIYYVQIITDRGVITKKVIYQ